MVGRLRDPPRLLLHGQAKMTRLWITHVHENQLQHCGGSGTLAGECRRQCWVWESSRIFKKVANECIKCRRMFPHPRAQAMGSLPPARYALQPMTPFEYTSLDYAGPWMVNMGGRRACQERYLLLFCCMSSRASCLEMTNGETTNDTLMALQRFGSRYRLPSHIYSDNAAAFVALQEFLAHWTGEQGDHPVNPSWLNVKWTFFTRSRPSHQRGHRIPD